MPSQSGRNKRGRDPSTENGAGRLERSGRLKTLHVGEIVPVIGPGSPVADAHPTVNWMRVDPEHATAVLHKQLKHNPFAARHGPFLNTAAHVDVNISVIPFNNMLFHTNLLSFIF